MKARSILVHNGVPGENLATYGLYLCGDALHEEALQKNLVKAQQGFANKTWRLMALIEYTYDEKAQDFSVSIIDKQVAPSPKLIEINLAAKQEKKPTKKYAFEVLL